jgi:magnesium chelatase family protein
VAIAQVHGVVLSGVQGAMVRVEVEVCAGLPSVGVVGLPDASVNESRWRARSAIAAVGATWPNQRVTINLSPAEVRKLGAGLDLPIAMGVLLASGQLPDVEVDDVVFIGELGLDGRLHGTGGALAGALAAREAGLRRVIVPAEGAADVARVSGVQVHLARDLAQAVEIVSGREVGETVRLEVPAQECEAADFRDVRGHEHARFALEVAAAGGHHVAFVGPPGVGKTLLAERLPGILPSLDDDAALEVAAIAAVASAPRSSVDFQQPPFQAPHHSASTAALLGAVHGSRVSPGAVTLAHHGVLFLDEAPEFARPVLEGLRQPLESGLIRLARSGWSGQLPARFQLVLAANPCPCGLRVGAGHECSCPPAALRRYGARLSGPLLDRVDIRLAIRRPAPAELAASSPREGSAAIRERVATARARSQMRLRDSGWTSNSAIPAGELRRRWPLRVEAADLLGDVERRSANLRGPDRVLRMAWTIADLAGRQAPSRDDVARALTLRGTSLAWAS